MTRSEFAKTAAYVGTATGKPLSPEGMEVYFDMLKDLPPDVFLIGAKRVLVEHKWATFPSIAELRSAAVDSMRGEISELSGGEAWHLAWSAVARIDLEVELAQREAQPFLG